MAQVSRARKLLNGLTVSSDYGVIIESNLQLVGVTHSHHTQIMATLEGRVLNRADSKDA